MGTSITPVANSTTTTASSNYCAYSLEYLNSLTIDGRLPSYDELFPHSDATRDPAYEASIIASITNNAVRRHYLEIGLSAYDHYIIAYGSTPESKELHTRKLATFKNCSSVTDLDAIAHPLGATYASWLVISPLIDAFTNISKGMKEGLGDYILQINDLSTTATELKQLLQQLQTSDTLSVSSASVDLADSILAKVKDFKAKVDDLDTLLKGDYAEFTSDGRGGKKYTGVEEATYNTWRSLVDRCQTQCESLFAAQTDITINFRFDAAWQDNFETPGFRTWVIDKIKNAGYNVDTSTTPNYTAYLERSYEAIKTQVQAIAARGITKRIGGVNLNTLSEWDSGRGPIVTLPEGHSPEFTFDLCNNGYSVKNLSFKYSDFFQSRSYPNNDSLNAVKVGFFNKLTTLAKDSATKGTNKDILNLWIKGGSPATGVYPNAIENISGFSVLTDEFSSQLSSNNSQLSTETQKINTLFSQCKEFISSITDFYKTLVQNQKTG